MVRHSAHLSPAIVDAFVTAAGDSGSASPAVDRDPIRQPDLRPHLQYSCPPRELKTDAKQLKQVEDDQSLAGLRATAKVAARIPGQIRLGKVLNALFDKILSADAKLENRLLLLVSGAISSLKLSSLYPPGLTTC